MRLPAVRDGKVVPLTECGVSLRSTRVQTGPRGSDTEEKNLLTGQSKWQHPKPVSNPLGSMAAPAPRVVPTMVPSALLAPETAPSLHGMAVTLSLRKVHPQPIVGAIHHHRSSISDGSEASFAKSHPSPIPQLGQSVAKREEVQSAAENRLEQLEASEPHVGAGVAHHVHLYAAHLPERSATELPKRRWVIQLSHLASGVHVQSLTSQRGHVLAVTHTCTAPPLHT